MLLHQHVGGHAAMDLKKKRLESQQHQGPSAARQTSAQSWRKKSSQIETQAEQKRSSKPFNLEHVVALGQNIASVIMAIHPLMTTPGWKLKTGGSHPLNRALQHLWILHAWL